MNVNPCDVQSNLLSFRRPRVQCQTDERSLFGINLKESNLNQDCMSVRISEYDHTKDLKHIFNF